MRLLPLPELSAPPIPASDRSVAAVVEALLRPECETARRTLASRLEADPPFALWACLAAPEHGVGPGTIDELARTLSDSGWRRFAAAGRLDAVADTAGWADRVAADVARATLAVTLHQDQPNSSQDALSSSVYLPALLHGATCWPTQPAGGRIGALADRVARFPAECRHSAEKAAEVLAMKVPPEALREPAAAARLAGEHARRLWIEPLPDAACLLPEIAALLARAAELETRFADALEAAKLDAMAELAAGAGHEINNPLAVIAGRAQLFLRTEKDPERRRELATINAQVKRAHEMIADMRLFARPPQPQLQRIDMVDLLAELAEPFAAGAAARGVAFDWRRRPTPVPVEADPEQIRVAVGALLRNSLESVGQDGRIELTLTDDDDDAVIAVTDNGRGITPEQRPHIFEPFYSARQAGRGLGLGLSKCWRIVQGHGGMITVESHPDDATVFRITLRKSRSP